jgi:lysyl-tRNA synthetase class 2
MASEEDLIEARRAKVRELAAAGVAAFPNDFRVDAEREAARKRAVELVTDPAARAALPLEDELSGSEEDVWVYGRVVGKRGPFLVIRTPYGDAQALVRDKVGKDGKPATISEHDAAVLAAIDLADHVAVQGPLIRTRTGDAAVRANRYQHVGKALLPPPEKWHGLTDVEKRYRERYVDLFAKTDVAPVFRARALVVKTLRSYLDAQGFLEVETPLLHPLRGGATATPFETHHNVLDAKLYLRIAPELYLKRLLVGGLDRVYEIGRCFRNEGVSTRHNPEFTMLELYRAYATYEELMDMTEEMLRAIDAALRSAFYREGRTKEQHPPNAWWDERAFTLEQPFVRVDMRDAIIARCSVDAGSREGIVPTPLDGRITRAILDDAAALEALVNETFAPAALKDRIGSLPNVVRQRWFDAVKHLVKGFSHGERVFALYEMLVEPDLAKLYRAQDGTKSLPVFITKHPFEISPLARKSDSEPAITDRFELFIEGRELANAFSELNDPDDQASRFDAQLERRTTGDEEAMDYDADYIRALSHGMPPAAGFGLGVDRLVMMLAGQPSIRDVLLFPALRQGHATQGHEVK